LKGENAKAGGKYALFVGEKSNKIGPWAESISQGYPPCDLSDDIPSTALPAIDEMKSEELLSD
jgi:hypothetical protein